MIELQHVWFSYDSPAESNRKRTQAARGQSNPADWGVGPDDIWALQDVSLTVHDNEILGIAGHTGSGKSTLIQHMNGLIHPTRGTVTVDGTDIGGKQQAAQVRERVGLVFQYPEHQLFAATVFDDIAFGPRNMGIRADQVEQRVRTACGQVDLDFDEVATASPFELSGGQQRRVALAGVLSMEPTTLVLDEPVAGLDPAARALFLHLIAQLHERDGITVVLVSHSMDDLAALCDRIAVLNKGSIYRVGTPEQVFADEHDLRSIGLGVPAAQHLANSLRARGVALPPALYTDETLAAALCAPEHRNDV